MNAKSFLRKNKSVIQPLKTIKQVQSTQAQLTSLENEVEILRSRIVALENFISSLPLNAPSTMQIMSSSAPIHSDASESLQRNAGHDTSALNNKTARQINEIKSSVMKAVHGDLINKKHRQRILLSQDSSHHLQWVTNSGVTMGPQGPQLRGAQAKRA